MKALAILTAAMMTLGTTVANAQTHQLSNQSKVEVLGTSNVHDWSGVVENVRGTANYTDGTLQNANFTFVVNSLNSGDNRMNDRMMTTLDEERYPNITFRVSNATTNGSRVSMTGNLTIHGVTKRVTVQGTMQELSNGNLKITGKHAVLFTDYGMDAPSFMLGAMRVANEVTVNFDVVFTKN